MVEERDSADLRRPLRRKSEGPSDLRWPPPTPLPVFPSDDVGRSLRQILERLDAIEKRLEEIEKILIQQQHRKS